MRRGTQRVKGPARSLDKRKFKISKAIEIIDFLAKMVQNVILLRKCIITKRFLPEKYAFLEHMRLLNIGFTMHFP